MASRYGKRWTAEEVTMTMEPFLRRGLLGDEDPEVQELARLFERTADAVALKMANLQWVQTKGRKGMKNKSKTDLRVWHQYENRLVQLREKVRELRKTLPWLNS